MRGGVAHGNGGVTSREAGGCTAPAVVSNGPFGVCSVALARMAGIPHVVRPANPRKAPKGKAPYMTHGGNTVADSELIMNYLTNTYLAHEEGAAGGAGARPTSGYLAFPAMTPEQLARRCVRHRLRRLLAL